MCINILIKLGIIFIKFLLSKINKSLFVKIKTNNKLP